MTESEWLHGHNLPAMTAFVGKQASERKRRLFACAYCHRSPEAWQARERQVLRRFEEEADAIRAQERPLASLLQGGLLSLLRDRGALLEIRLQILSRFIFLGWPLEPTAAERDPQVARACAALREVFGNPFRPPRLDPAWLAWNGGAVGSLARSIYAEKAFGEIPVLADALEDAGCADPAVLAHLRGGDSHARGCWVLDLLLGRS
jgi:hypothetical protein